MPFWPFRRRRRVPIAATPPDDVLALEELLRKNVEDVLVVKERQLRGLSVAFGGNLLLSPDRALEVLESRFKPYGYTPFVRQEGGLVWVQALPLAEVAEPPRVRTNVVLFVLTCLSTLFAGTQFIGSPTFDALRDAPFPAWVLSGIPFAGTLLGILVVHEFGHYFTARRYRASVSLPYFIPAPPPIFFAGTLGAIIQMRSPARDRNSLFDIAVAGPLAGLAVAVPAIVVGLAWSTIQRIPPGGHLEFGTSLLMRWLLQWRFGEIPAGMAVFTHPMADAAWFGFLVTALNLMPVGQLDGGRIAYAVFGERHRQVGIATFVALLAMGVLTGSASWFVWAALLFFLIGFHHSPPMDDVTPLTPGRRALGIGCLILLVLLIPPVPIDVK